MFSDPNKYYIASSRPRVPNLLGTTSATNQFYISGIALETMPFASRAYRVVINAGWYVKQQNTYKSETALTDTTTWDIEGCTIGYGATFATATWVQFKFSGANGVTGITPSTTKHIISDELTVSIPANTPRWIRLAWKAPLSVPFMTGLDLDLGTGNTNEGQASSTTTLTAKLTDGTSINTSGRISSLGFSVSAVVCKGFDGRPVFAGLGDSIQQNVEETAQNQSRTYAPVGSVAPQQVGGGFLARGVADNSGSNYRTFVANLAVAATGPAEIYTNTDAIDYRAGIFDTIAAVNGGDPGFTHWFTNYGTNSLGAPYNSLSTFKAMIEGTITKIKAKYNKPVCVATLIPKATTTDGWLTLANQTVLTIDQDPASYAGGSVGVRWAYNDALLAGQVAGVDFVVNTMQYVTASSTSGTPGTNRDKWKITPVFDSTISNGGSAWTVSTTIPLAAAPKIGDRLVIDPIGTNGNGNGVHVINVTGSGPYVATLNTAPTGGPYTDGSRVIAPYAGDTAGLHPGEPGHDAMKAAITTLESALWS